MTPDYAAARTYTLGALRPVGPSDLMRELRVTYNRACSLLEELEADRLLGSFAVHGVRCWSTALPVSEDRVAMLRGVSKPVTSP